MSDAKSRKKLLLHPVAETLMRRMAPPGTECDDIPLPSALICNIRALNIVLERKATRCAEEHGLTMPQWMALGCIGNGGGEGITHSDLGHRLMISKAPITGVVDRLERDGMVQRLADEHDRRVSRIVITARGTETWMRVRSALRDYGAEQCACLSPQEQHAAIELLARLLDSAAAGDPMLSSLPVREEIDN